MSIPAGFQFSQGSLQDYVDCYRRFQLKYLLRLSWPTIESEPVLESERLMLLGTRFHHLVHQHLLGVPVEQLAIYIQDEDLDRWWENYLLAQNPSGEQEVKAQFPEMSLSAAVGGFRLVAKYDLIVTGASGRLVVVDWKTSRKRARRQWLLERLQTRVYPYLLVLAGTQFLPGSAIHPEQVEMVYWFTEYPDQSERIPYSQNHFERDRTYLEGLIADIQHRGEDEFSLTTDEKRCVYCSYRSLCDRGGEAGDFNYFEEDLQKGDEVDIELDFDQIPEIAF